MNKLLLFLMSFLLLSACQTVVKHGQNATRTAPRPTQPPLAIARPESTSQPSPTPPASIGEAEHAQPPSPVPALMARPKLALILGPGGIRSYAHAGFLQEIGKAKIPVHWIGGLEMGALPSALFATKGLPFEAEWQMMKLKEEDLLDQGLLSRSGSLSAESLSGALQNIFGSARAEDAKITNACPSFSTGKKQTFLMNRGPFAQMLLYCLPAQPLFQSFQGNGAHPFALADLIQAARQKGSQVLIYVDLLAESPVPLSDGGFEWGLYQQALEQQSRQATEVVRIAGLPGLRDFGRRREMVQKGQEAGRRLVQILQMKYGF